MRRTSPRRAANLGGRAGVAAGRRIQSARRARIDHARAPFVLLVTVTVLAGVLSAKELAFKGELEADLFRGHIHAGQVLKASVTEPCLPPFLRWSRVAQRSTALALNGSSRLP
jgi:hypothetical protein